MKERRGRLVRRKGRVGGKGRKERDVNDRRETKIDGEGRREERWAKGRDKDR